jgi:hypothetical protein
MADLLAATDHATHNRAEIEASRLCGCFYCTQIFPPSEIVAWTGLDVSSLDNPESVSTGTALCPRCGSESVIGDKSGFGITPEFLNQMHQAWHQKTVIRKPAAKG